MGLPAVPTLTAGLGLDEASLAVYLSVAADAAAALPTVRKAWRDPASENLLFYVMVGAGATITLLTIRTGEPQAWAFAAYILALCVIVGGVVASRRTVRR